MVTSTAVPQPTATRTSTTPHRTRTFTIALGVCAAVLVVAGGVALGQRLTAGPATLAPTAPTSAVSFPSDWQVYRAGERGDVPPVNHPGDWTTYRAGER